MPPKSDKFVSMIACDKKKLESATHPLSKLYRKILVARIQSYGQWDNLLRRYVESPANNKGKDKVGISQDKARIHTQLSDPNSMSWKTIMMGIRILAPRSVRFIAEITWKDGTTTSDDVNIIIEGNRGDNND